MALHQKLPSLAKYTQGKTFDMCASFSWDICSLYFKLTGTRARKVPAGARHASAAFLGAFATGRATLNEATATGRATQNEATATGRATHNGR